MNFTDHLRSLLMPYPKKGGMLSPGLLLNGDSIMAHAIGNKLINRGIAVLDFAQPGDTAQNAWRRFAYDIRSMGTIVLEHGTNDITGGNDPVPYLKRMAQYAQAEGRRVVFTGICFREAPSQYSWIRANQDILELAQDLGCSHAGWNTVEYSSADGLHPDDPMADRLVDRLMQTLAS